MTIDTKEKRKPMRTCIGCREKKEKTGLVRLVCGENGIVVDGQGTENGRGAYVCPDRACILKLMKTKALNRTFRRAFSEADYRSLEEQFDKRESKSR